MTDPTGLFSFDTRFLSKWLLTLNGERLSVLSTDDLRYFETRFFLVPGTGTVYVDAKVSVIRQRAVGGGFREQLKVLNHDDEPVDLTIRVDAASDFADLFEVKDALKKQGSYSARTGDRTLALEYRRDTFSRATVISTSGARGDRREWLHVPDQDRSARVVDHRPRRLDRTDRSEPGRTKPGAGLVREPSTPRSAPGSRSVARRRARPRM